MWRRYNPNPSGSRVGDCVVRALSKAIGASWADTYTDLCMVGLELCDMPSANRTWGELLRRCGFERRLADADTTVRDFCREHPRGTYVLAISGHVVCAQDGDWYDSWDSGDEVPVYYWRRRV